MFFGTNEHDTRRIASMVRRVERIAKNHRPRRKRYYGGGGAQLAIVKFVLTANIGGAAGPESTATVVAVILGSPPTDPSIDLYDALDMFSASTGAYGLAFYSPTAAAWIPFQIQCASFGAPASPVGGCCQSVTLTLSTTLYNGACVCAFDDLTIAMHLRWSSRQGSGATVCQYSSAPIDFCGNGVKRGWHLQISRDDRLTSPTYGKWKWHLFSDGVDIFWGKDWTTTANPCAGHTLTQAGYMIYPAPASCSGITSFGFITVSL